MTSDDAKRDDNQETGTALTATPAAGIAPFIAAAQAAPLPTRGLLARLLDYSAHAAIVVGLVGVAWTIGSHLSAKPTAAQIEAPTKMAAAVVPAVAHSPVPSPASAKIDELGELRAQNKHLSDEVSAMRSNLDALRANIKQDRSQGEVRALEADLKTVKSGLATTKSETDSALAQLNGKVDKLQHDPQASSRMQQLVDRLGRLEHGTTDASTTGSIKKADESSVAKSAPKPPAKPMQIASADPARTDDTGKPQVLTGWVVRDVYDGVALIEGKRGPMEVVPGVNIPGAGVVRSIDRKGNGWTVTTSKGLLAFAAPPRDYHRTTYRDYYERDPSGF